MAGSFALDALEAAVQSQARGLGAHYTPYEIVERIVRTTLGPLCAGLAAHEVPALRVLDPAVGSGRFLVAALDFLTHAAGGDGRTRALIGRQCLYGVDVDPCAVDLARRAVAAAAEVLPEELARHLVVGDSLLAGPAALLGAEAFDAVLANPPWISYSGRHAAAIEPARRRRLAERFASFRGWPTTHGAFLELAAGLLRPGGRAALVVPQQMCHLAGYEAARRAADALCCLEPPPEMLGEGCFDGVVQPAAVLYLRRRTGGESGAWAADEPLAHGAEVRSFLEQMRRHPPAPPGTFRDPGVHTGNSAALLLYDEPAEGRVPVREGRCIHPFSLDEPRRWLDAAPRLPPGRYCRIGRPEACLGARILLRQTANRPVAARHTAPAYFRNSVLACYGISGLDDAALLGLLNSAPVAFYHRCCHADSGQRAFPQVKVSHLQALPIAREAGELAPLARRLEALAAEPEGRPALRAAAIARARASIQPRRA
ncbi:MAG TPA: N-6 DNA methylase, partial [Planctomycetota bacterium]|nr:N-6 DNA methylase [Planctomycetota bacterium]